MTLSSKSIRAILLTMLLADLPACQMDVNLRQEGLDNAEFMNMWQTYTRCVTSFDLDSTQQDSFHLRTMTYIGDRSGESKPHFRRIAVDVKAMSASCTLHAGDIAVTNGRNDTARDMFNAVLNEHAEPLYGYYIEQARARLIKLGTGLQASLRQL